MLTRRSIVTGIGLAAVAPARWAAAQPAARVHALLVGINAYTGVGVAPLQGCVNDLEVLARALRPIASGPVRTLVDAAATRRRFLAAWAETLAASRADDLIFLSFSGHGGQEKERRIGSEADGLDETLIFAEFDAGRAPQSADRLIDDDIEGLLEQAERRSVRVLFAADCCHSGSLTRSVDRRRGRLAVRTLGRYVVDDDALTDTVAPSSHPPDSQAPNVTFLAACQDHEQAPELRINGRPHGALSVALAAALEGHADLDGDGIVSAEEISRYVVRNVQAAAERLQHPRATFGGDPHAPLLRVPTARAGVPTDAHVAILLLNADRATATRVVAAMPGVSLAAGAETADLIWDAAARAAIDAQGSIIAHHLPEAALPGAHGRIVALRRLRALVAARTGFDIGFVASGEQLAIGGVNSRDSVHPSGKRLDFVINAMPYAWLVIFAIAGDGTVQHLFPRRGDPPRVSRITLEARAPFGADQVVALALPQQPDQAVRELAALHGRRAPLEAAALVVKLLDREGAIALTALFTAPA